MQDAYLPQRLLDKLMFMYNYVEMARVTGVPISFLLSRGQSIKVERKIFISKAHGHLVMISDENRTSLHCGFTDHVTEVGIFTDFATRCFLNFLGRQNRRTLLFQMPNKQDLSKEHLKVQW